MESAFNEDEIVKETVKYLTLASNVREVRRVLGWLPSVVPDYRAKVASIIYQTR